jgi:hypothetical protein
MSLIDSITPLRYRLKEFFQTIMLVGVLLGSLLLFSIINIQVFASLFFAAVGVMALQVIGVRSSNEGLIPRLLILGVAVGFGYLGYWLASYF